MNKDAPPDRSHWVTAMARPITRAARRPAPHDGVPSTRVSIPLRIKSYRWRLRTKCRVTSKSLGCRGRTTGIRRANHEPTALAMGPARRLAPAALLGNESRKFYV